MRFHSYHPVILPAIRVHTVADNARKPRLGSPVQFRLSDVACTQRAQVLHLQDQCMQSPLLNKSTPPQSAALHTFDACMYFIRVASSDQDCTNGVMLADELPYGGNVHNMKRGCEDGRR